MTEDFAARIGALAGVAVADVRDVGTRHGFRHLTGTLADGRAVFVKAAAGDGRGRRTRSRPRRTGCAGSPGPERFRSRPCSARTRARWSSSCCRPANRRRARPATSARRWPECTPPARPGFGAPWPGYIASLPLDNTPLDNAPVDNAPVDNAPAGDTSIGNAGEPDWGSWYAERRLVPYLRRARDGGALSAADARPVEAVIGRIGELAGPPEPPSRIHGDLWAGNVLWPGGRGALIDPAAHGGHRETDLAMLALFGAPYLDEILRAYHATVPLADGWRSRVPLHQLHPLLVHACLFGAAYAPQVTAAARQPCSLTWENRCASRGETDHAQKLEHCSVPASDSLTQDRAG